jgi:GLPGLI family protein
MLSYSLKFAIMKQMILVSFILIFFKNLNAQVNYIEVEYKFNITTPQGESSTFFKTLKDDGKASVFLNKDTITVGNSMVMKVDKSKNLGVFINKVANKLYQYEPIFNKDFYIKEDSLIEKFQWTIYDTVQKIILGYNCKLATCEFRGRKYNAYFSELLPFNTGPWKLTGLPGTILEASTKDGRYKFEAYKISTNSRATIITNPYKSDRINFVTFNEHKILFLKKISELQSKAQSQEKDEDVTYNFEDNSIELLKQQ